MAAVGALTLSGTGVAVRGLDIGALDNVAGDNTWTAPVYLDSITGFTQINSDAGALTLSRGVQKGAASGATGSLTVGGAGNVTISGATG